MAKTKLKCWKLKYKNKIATNWGKKGKYLPTLQPMMDIRLISKDKKDYRLETFDLGEKKYYERFNTRKQAEKRAIQIMKKDNKC